MPYHLPPYRLESLHVALDAADRIDWGLALLHIPEQWRITQGAGVTVALLDTGIDAAHPDLRDALIDARDFTRSRRSPADLAGHGTHCAGIIGARRNQQGVVGVAPECRLLVGKVLGDDGAGQSDGIAAGLDWACDQGADIISLSFGSPAPDAVIAAAIQRAAAKGKFLLAAAGNDGASLGRDLVNYPARYRETIAVAAFNQNRQLAAFSSQGPEVDIAAPGEGITSTFPLAKGGYAKLSGTSMATPFVAGVVALLLAQHRRAPANHPPLETVAHLRQQLARTAVDAGPPGRDWGYGFGLIAPDELLGAATPPTPQPTSIPLPGGLVLHFPPLAGDVCSLGLAE